jgi:predicted dehydrogenase
MIQQPGRRELVVGSAAALLLSGVRAEAAEDIRTAHIGVGHRGSTMLKAALEAQNVKVAAICDIDPQAQDKALSTASRDKPKSVTEWRKVLEMKDVGAVIIAVPCDLNAEMAVATLQAGKHIYLEKPLGITAEQVGQVLAAARRSPAVFQIGLQMRYYPVLREAVRRIHDGSFTGSTYIIKAQRDDEPTRKVNPIKWEADVKRSGDLIVENAVHNLDVCNWIANSRPVSAYGHGKKYFPKPIPAGTILMDGFSVEFIYENEVHCQYSHVSFHPRTMKALPSGQWYTIFGEKGSVFMTPESAEFFDLHGESEPQDMVKDLADKSVSNANATALADFFSSVREKRQPFADIKVGATAALTAILGREAIYKGRSVSWNEMGITL